MILQMLLAHMIGDFVLQTNYIAAWKGRSRWGVIFHGSIVLAVTVLITLYYQADYSAIPFVKWAFFIGIMHILIDLSNLKFAHFISDQGHSALIRFIIDQILHLSVIAGALHFAGFTLSWAELMASISAYPILSGLLVYVWMSMPAWVAIEFLVSGILKHKAPDFTQGARHKYSGILQRWFITTGLFFGFGLTVVLIPIFWQLVRYHKQIFARLQQSLLVDGHYVPNVSSLRIMQGATLQSQGLLTRIRFGALAETVITGGLAISMNFALKMLT